MKPRLLARVLVPSVLLACACASPPPAPELALADAPLASDEAAPVRPPRPLEDEGAFYVLGADPRFPRVRYRDGQVSLNASCAIRVENPLGRRIPPVYVNGRPIGFC